MLSRQFSPAFLDARAVLTALAMPLLAIAAARGRRLRRPLSVSRQVVFHGATLVVAGAFLLGIVEVALIGLVGSGWTPACVFVVMLVFLLLRPRGISGVIVQEKA